MLKNFFLSVVLVSGLAHAKISRGYVEVVELKNAEAVQEHVIAHDLLVFVGITTDQNDPACGVSQCLAHRPLKVFLSNLFPGVLVEVAAVDLSMVDAKAWQLHQPCDVSVVVRGDVVCQSSVSLAAVLRKDGDLFELLKKLLPSDLPLKLAPKPGKQALRPLALQDDGIAAPAPAVVEEAEPEVEAVAALVIAPVVRPLPKR